MGGAFIKGQRDFAEIQLLPGSSGPINRENRGGAVKSSKILPFPLYKKQL